MIPEIKQKSLGTTAPDNGKNAEGRHVVLKDSV